jgi:hypothetical protein
MAGGSAEAERQQFARYAQDIMRVQLKNARAASARGVPHPVDRAFHAKSTLAVDGELCFRKDIAEDLRDGFVQRGACYPTVVRLSNAAGAGQPDTKPDLRGVALRVQVPKDKESLESPEEKEVESHDLLMTNYPVSHARNAYQFVEFAKATAGNRVARLLGILRLMVNPRIGPVETIRMLVNVSRGRRRRVRSVATQTYWSRGAMRWGPTLAVRYLLRPAPGTLPAPTPPPDDPNYLATEATRRLAHSEIRFELCVQRYVNGKSTPIEDTAVRWSERVSPPEPVAVLTIPEQDVTTVEAVARARDIDAMAFNPWNTTEEFRPLGNLNRARKMAYDASAAQRRAYRWKTVPPLRNRVIGAVLRGLFAVLNRFVQWYQLRVHPGLLNVQVLRQVLRQRNLYDTEPQDAPPAARQVPPPPQEEERIYRTYEGDHNDLSEPTMGAVGATFGRNLPPDYRPDTFDEPNPVTVSDQLLKRERFLPAESLNLLAAAWIQFQVHDWVHHARYSLGMQDVTVPLPGDRPSWTNKRGEVPERQMRIAGNVPFPGHGPPSMEPVFANTVSHWWDASEVYGSDRKTARQLRDGAKLRMEDGYLPDDGTAGVAFTGFNEAWWLGLGAMHTLFAREHNLLCDELRARYRTWEDERVYQTARLIVSALIAKIHTIEWTPAILGDDVINIALNTNWSGPPAHDWLTRLGTWLVDQHAEVGILQTKPDHHGVPYSLTEDFVTVYRMHPLIPDDYEFLDHQTGKLLGQRGFLDIQGDRADPALREFGLANALYSFGLANPGAITLHNYPSALRHFQRPNGEIIDLSVVDLVRTRRRGVPRYNDFRAGLHKPRIKDWSQLCDNEESVRRLREVYRGIDDVDTMVGLFAETPPPAFGFSDTAFRIFILMASRRLQSDRFLTVDFRPEVYSPFGMDWIANNGMKSIIQRHCPDLATVMPRDKSAFAPWRPAVPPVPTPRAEAEAARPPQRQARAQG